VSVTEREADTDMAIDTQHAPVLVEEVLRWLTPVPAGTWIVDGTVGLGGHAAALLARTSDSRLLGLDRDTETLALAARRLAPFGARCVLRHADFRHIGAEARASGAAPAHAVLLDLGLSSYQLERSGRGFSFQTDEGLDMRFDRRQRLTAA
jgi:16S rRNA (cytosine1402-N4)-methyltransferase